MDSHAMPEIEFLQLTADDNDYIETNDDWVNDGDCCNWLDDSECQENLTHIWALSPEETIIDAENHIHTTEIKMFCEELGVFTEEPEPIDPTRDYEAEAALLIEERNKTRQKHINLSPTPSLLMSSGLSSTASSFHHFDEDTPLDHGVPYLPAYHQPKYYTHQHQTFNYTCHHPSTVPADQSS
ncbi:uncharacterized protein BYT42DRAFT_556123 [Radiomyces spectabilis]|uniref:uncharacterized protein n=1 Tax=Radiomyces spectabilis TaxID=64574 RepID=UPI00222017C2|nr:uncharacterized protein BYT42DRAFT_556123 [Radiomyces spectabilis]KAI8391233.1 hypothetical protein BYT42DRAFT_556123 [Radiomyces spectabilis]